MLASFVMRAQQNEVSLSWETDFNTAKLKAKKSNKPILMLFTGSDWCPPCKLLKKDFFNSSKFIAKADNFVLLLVDFPKNKKALSKLQETQNKQLNLDYGVRSLPTLIAVNYQGHIINKIKDYNAQRNTSSHFNFIENVLKSNL